MDIIKSTKRDAHAHYMEMLLTKVIWTLRFCGTWCLDNNWLYALVAFCFLCLSFTIIIWQHIFLYQNRTNFDYVTDTYSTMLTMIFVCHKQILLLIHRKEYKRLLNVIKNDFWPINCLDDDKSIQNIFTLANKCFTVYLISIVFIAQLWMIFPPDKLPGHRKMPIYCWYPFNADISPVREIVYLLIMLAALYMSLGIYGYEYIFFQLIFHLHIQYKLLRRCLRSINNRRIIDESNSNDDTYAFEELKFCVNHHILLKKFYEEVAVMLNANLGVHFSVASFTVVVAMYLVQIETDPVKQIKFLLFLFALIFELAMYCFAGTIIEEMGASISYAAYESKWYEFKPRFRLGLIRLIQISNDSPLRLSCYGLFYINNSTLISVLKTAFSMSTFMVNIKNAKDKLN